MEQLELFDDSDIFKVPNSHYLGTRDWEVDCREKLFDNTMESSNNESIDDDKKLFDNKNKLTELAVSEYSPGGTASKGNIYYRFSYRERKRTKHIHIKGGNISNPLAIKRKGLVEAWIREDVPLEKIIQWIKEW